MNKSLYRFNQN